MSTTPPTKPRHRGTWATLAIIVLMAVGICAVVFGVFSLPTGVLRGASFILLGAGLTLPGLWWLRWYQRPSLAKYFLTVAGLLIGPGAVGLALEFRDGASEPSENAVVATPVTSSSTAPASSTTSTPPSSESSTTSTSPTSESSEPETPTELPTVEEPQPVLDEPSTPELSPPAVPAPAPLPAPAPAPVPAPATLPAPAPAPAPAPPPVDVNPQPETPVQPPEENLPAEEAPVVEEPPTPRDPLAGLLPQLPF